MIKESEVSQIKIGGETNLKVSYPTINKTKNGTIKKLLDGLSADIWNQIEDLLSEEELLKNNFLSLKESFKVLH